MLKNNKVEQLASESLPGLWDFGYVPLFFWKVIALRHGEGKGRHILFRKNNVFSVWFLSLSPGKILCNIGDGCVAFTISKDEKSVLAKCKLKLGCVREKT